MRNGNSGKERRAGHEKVEPMYDMDDADNTLKLLEPCRYGEVVQVADGLKAEFIDAGHLLGSASVRLTCLEGGVTKTIVFSGDIGNKNQPIIRDPQYFSAADYVVMESTLWGPAA